ncbi:HAD-like domain-containing protein [Biscogniauxia marginata]|nr:HAD-like domain-containing protein [Biscogniauxia marginata]
MSSSSQHPDLTTFKALSFDCYGTLIDWETGMQDTLGALTSQLPPTHPLNTSPPTPALRRLDALAVARERASPTLPYNEVLAASLADLARELGLPLADGAGAAFGRSPGTWAAFGDTVTGLQRLAARYELVILSNVDNANIAETVSGPLGSVPFAAVYTAQDVGSYKPARANFEYLFARARANLGVDAGAGELLHVARSLRADHVPARELGLRSVWISRGGDREGGQGIGGGDYARLRDQTAFEWRFDTIGDFADEVDRQFAAKEQKK